MITNDIVQGVDPWILRWLILTSQVDPAHRVDPCFDSLKQAHGSFDS